MSSQNKLSTPRAPRRIAIVVRDGMDYGQFIKTLIDLEKREQAQIYVLASRLGSVCCHNGQRVAVDATLRRWSGASFDEVYVMQVDEARLMKSALIEEVFTRAAQCAGAMVVNLLPHVQSHAQPSMQAKARPQAKLATLGRLLAPSLVMGAMWAPVHAQEAPPAGPVVIDPSATNVPYVTDSNRTIVRSSTALCYHTGTWTVEAAASTKVVGSDFPAGCYCDKSLMPKEACEPKPVVAPPLPPQPVPVPPPPPAPVPEKVSVPADALFAFDKAVLTADGRSQLTTYADQLKALNLESVVAIGHTDRIGSEKYNQKLSERRANAVKAFLVEQGVPADKVFSEGRGESQPVTGDKCDKMGRENASNHKLVACLAPDRRVDIEAVGVHR